MYDIAIQKKDEKLYRVVVTPVDGTSGMVTEHDVTVFPQYAEILGGAKDIEKLIRLSFEFLLERESNDSILHEFDLPDISGYFPEYESWIKSHLAS